MGCGSSVERNNPRNSSSVLDPSAPRPSAETPVEMFSTSDDLDNAVGSTAQDVTTVSWEWKSAKGTASKSEDTLKDIDVRITKGNSDGLKLGPERMETILELEDLDDSDFDGALQHTAASKDPMTSTVN